MLMGLNKMLERINGGEKALGAFMYTPDEEVVELCGRLGFDFFNFDAQHTAIPPATIERMCRVADGYAMAAVMRLPDGEESTILSYLDRGVSGIVIPNLETREQAESLVKYAKFAPQGLRSFTSLRVAKFGLHEGDLRSLMEEVNANTIPMPMFESITALDNLDEILSVPGYEYFGGPRAQ